MIIKKLTDSNINVVISLANKCIYILILVHIFFALIISAFYYKFYPDYDTALFWITELTQTVKQISGVAAITYIILNYINK